MRCHRAGALSRSQQLPNVLQRRQYAVQAPGAPTIEVFSRRVKWLQRERAAADVAKSRQVDYLRDEVATRLCERLQYITRHFPKVLDLGANACNVSKALASLKPEAPAEDGTDANTNIDMTPLAQKITSMISVDSSSSMLHRDTSLPFNSALSITRSTLSDEETLPYEASTFDAVLSSLSLHWINNLPSVLSQINHILKPDAPFIAAMLGGDSLFELRTSLQLAELERRGGVATHVSPLADVRDVGGLLQKAGFKMLTVDVDDIVVGFPDVFALMQDLQAMGESNAVLGREMGLGALRRDVMLASQAIYKELHGDEDGTLPATFRVIYMIGWKDSPTQAKPLPRGSGEINLQDVLSPGKGKT